MAKLTKSFIDRIPIPPKKANGKANQAIYRDESLSCFGLLVGSGGTKSFFVEKRINGRVKRISIGRYGHLTPIQAKTKAHELLGEIALGNDPAAKKQDQEARSITLRFAFEDYLKTRKNLSPNTIRVYRVLFSGCLEDWLPKKLIDITKDMIEQRHCLIGQRAPVQANNVMHLLRAIFNHSIAKYENGSREPILPFNPVGRLSQSRAWYKVERRRGHLKPHELKPWFNATLELPSDVSRDYMHFLLFTGLRKMVAATLSWEQVSFEDSSFTINNTKEADKNI